MMKMIMSSYITFVFASVILPILVVGSNKSGAACLSHPGRTASVDISHLGLPSTVQAHYQLSSESLTELTLSMGRGRLTHNQTLSIATGKFTGRSPKDRFVVNEEATADRVDWGNINIGVEKATFDNLKAKMLAYLSEREVYVRDAFAGSSESHRLAVRVVNEYPEHNLFALNMFINPTEEELELGISPDWYVYQAPDFKADPAVDGTRQENFAILCFSERTILIGGTGYTGEIKKGIFSALNFVYPVEHNTLPMHCSANIGLERGDTALFFGLSGTGKTTLSADPSRSLIGDDEHGWTADDEIFNFEGGCYAKVVDLTEEKEPDIWNAIRPGALLENVIMDELNVPDYTDTSITENTRVSYPLSHIDLIALEPGTSAPENIFFLTADAYGVLPPLSKLTSHQAAYHFMSGYTAKVAGTEAGVLEPQATFSACFGAPFMPLHPSKYAEMLMSKSRNTTIWLLNTGWVGGAYGVGSRIKLKYTRAMITAALNGELEEVETSTDEVFGLHRITSCPNVPSEVLDPRAAWSDTAAYDAQALMLAGMFRDNFRKFEAGSSEAILMGGPL